MPNAKVWDCTLDEYFADRHYLNHGAKELFRRSPSYFYEVYIAMTAAKPQQTKAQRLGIFTHLCVLEPERWENSIAILPKIDKQSDKGKLLAVAMQDPVAFTEKHVPGPEDIRELRKKDDKARWLEVVEANPGKTVVKHEHYQSVLEIVQQFQGKTLIDEPTYLLVQRMAQAVRENRRARKLLKMDGVAERAITWDCVETGLPCKARLDWALVSLIADLKAVRDSSPSGFVRAVHNFGYARQAAHYLSGYEDLIQQEAAWLFVAVQSSEPHSVGVYELGDATTIVNRRKTTLPWIEKAHAQNIATMRDLKRRRDLYEQSKDRSVWLDTWELQVEKIHEPHYAAYEGTQYDDENEENDE